MVFLGNKDELELRNSEIKKNADVVRVKLNCEWTYLSLSHLNHVTCTVDTNLSQKLLICGYVMPVFVTERWNCTVHCISSFSGSV